MTQTSALWWSSRPRRVDHDCDVVRVRAFSTFFQQSCESRSFLTTARDKLAITYDVAPCLCIERDNVPHFRKLLANAEHSLKLLTRIDEDKLGIRMINDVSNLLCRARRIKTDANST